MGTPAQPPNSATSEGITLGKQTPPPDNAEMAEEEEAAEGELWWLWNPGESPRRAEADSPPDSNHEGADETGPLQTLGAHRTEKEGEKQQWHGHQPWWGADEGPKETLGAGSHKATILATWHDRLRSDTLDAVAGILLPPPLHKASQRDLLMF